MQVAICDDDRGCCSQIEKWLINYRKREKVEIQVDVYFTAESLLNEIKNKRWYDVIFLDIELPQKTGIELGHEIRKSMDDERISIIFISGKTEYCQELFDLEPQNFHCKPLSEKKIILDMEKAVKRTNTHKKILKYMDGNIPRGILLGKIIYIEAKEKTLIVHTKDNESVIVRESVVKVSREFARDHICQCHRSYLVNLFYVDRYESKELYMSDGTKIPIGRKYQDNIKAAWASYDEGLY